MPKYHCSTCGNEVVYQGRLPALYPFCTPRCRLVDLGRWLREQYSISRDLTEEEIAALHRGRGIAPEEGGETREH
jgi:endogenous inhibitor of DNA gyrase (YacG/DUF329 family)